MEQSLLIIFRRPPFFFFAGCAVQDPKAIITSIWHSEYRRQGGEAVVVRGRGSLDARERANKSSHQRCYERWTSYGSDREFPGLPYAGDEMGESITCS